MEKIYPTTIMPKYENIEYLYDLLSIDIRINKSDTGNYIVIFTVELDRNDIMLNRMFSISDDIQKLFNAILNGVEQKIDTNKINRLHYRYNKNGSFDLDIDYSEITISGVNVKFLFSTYLRTLLPDIYGSNKIDFKRFLTKTTITKPTYKDEPVVVYLKESEIDKHVKCHYKPGTLLKFSYNNGSLNKMVDYLPSTKDYVNYKAIK